MQFRVRFRPASREVVNVYGSVPYWVDAGGLLCAPDGDHPQFDAFAALVSEGHLASEGPRLPIVVDQHLVAHFERVPGTFVVEPCVAPQPEPLPPVVDEPADEAPDDSQPAPEEVSEPALDAPAEPEQDAPAEQTDAPAGEPVEADQPSEEVSEGAPTQSRRGRRRRNTE